MILAYPHALQHNSKFKLIIENLSIPYTYDKNDNYDVVFNSNLNPVHEFDLKTDKPIINRYCNNVSKDSVDKRWKGIYGHGLKVDPRTWDGYCVEKPLGQGTNSGNLVKGIKPRDGMFYCKLVDTRIDVATLHDFRVVIINGEIVLTIKKEKHILSLFTHQKRYKTVINVFSNDEIDAILNFSSIIDFGELDILRSNFDGRIYVVDVNNLPGYGYLRQKEYLDLLSTHFKIYYDKLLK